jgi:uncharacterized protein involved in type VI secretion and phage assembly
LIHEEGLFHYLEHTGDAASPGLGSHTIVIADHNGTFQPNAQASIAFSQPGAIMAEDTLDRWRTELRMRTNAIELSSWDYRSLDTRPVGAASADTGDNSPLVSRDTPGAYAYQSREQGQRIADNQLQALEAGKEIHVGAGTVRTLAPGTTFTLTGQAQFDLAAGDDERSFLVVRTVHLMHNNLSADLQSSLTQRLGQALLAALIGEEENTSLHKVGKAIGERPLYRNRIDAIRSNVPYRSSGVDAHGQLLHPRPTINGQQTAIVVGPGGAPIHTDRDHRVKVQFHWQRGAQSHSRLQHPILEGNIDRPVVLGTVYNGRGQANAQHNQVAGGAGVATGNAPAWFPGEAGGHADRRRCRGSRRRRCNRARMAAVRITNWCLMTAGAIAVCVATPCDRASGHGRAESGAFAASE